MLARCLNTRLIFYRGFFDKIKKIFTRPTNAPIGPVPGFNPDLVPLISTAKRTKDNFYIPTEAEYTDFLDHLLVVAYGTAEAIVHAPESVRFLAGQSLFSLAHVYDRLSDYRRKNWFRELPGSLRYASLMSDVPNHGEFLFSDTDRTTKDVRLLSATEVTEQCEKAKEAYKKLKNATYVPLLSL